MCMSVCVSCTLACPNPLYDSQSRAFLLASRCFALTLPHLIKRDGSGPRGQSGAQMHARLHTHTHTHTARPHWPTVLQQLCMLACKTTGQERPCAHTRVQGILAQAQRRSRGDGVKLTCQRAAEALCHWLKSEREENGECGGYFWQVDHRGRHNVDWL